MPSQRTYSAGRISLELEGKAVGPLVSAEGGECFGVVVSEPRAGGQQPGKHIARTDFAPITLRFGLSMAKAVYAWIGDALESRATPKSGALLLADFDGRVQTRIEFADAVITGVALDSLDATDHGVPWLLTVTLQPERTRRVAGRGEINRFPPPAKAANTSSFRVKLSALPASLASAVEFPIASAVSDEPARDPRDPSVHSPELALSNLVLSVRPRDEKVFYDAAEKFLLEGHSTEADEFGGQVELMAPNMRDTVLAVTFRRLGFVRVTPVRYLSGEAAGATRCIRVELYCEGMALGFTESSSAIGNAPGGASAPSTTPAVTTADVNALAGLSATVLGLTVNDRRDALVSAAAELLSAGHVTRPGPELVAVRLRGGVQDGGAPGGALQRADGSAIARAWAEQVASLDELAAVAGLESADWDVVALPAGHSLLARLVASGAVVGDSDHPADLDRTAFVEGLVSGAAEVLREVRPHL